MQTSVILAAMFQEERKAWGEGGNWLRLMLYELLLTFPIPRSLAVFSRQQTKIREICDLQVCQLWRPLRRRDAFDVAKWGRYGKLGIGVPFAFARRCCFLA